MIEETMGWKQEKRTQNLTWIDPALIQSGDFLAVTRMVGLGAIIMYGTGAHISHSLMALRFDGELYILESVGPLPGVRRTKWSEWIEGAMNEDFNVSWLPLKQEIRDKFDEKAA